MITIYGGLENEAKLKLHKEMIRMHDQDYCYECSGYGDDYYIDDDGELQCRCETCPFSGWENED